MWKVLIADDEPKIRRGLKKTLNWKALDMEVVGEAEDGEIALDMAQSVRPDIMLVDICMPFINGLELIERLNIILNDCIIIVITGHDEFSYAQKAVKLKVFDFLLKPVSKEQLHQTICKGKEVLLRTQKKNEYVSWAKQQLEENSSYLKERFLNDWIKGRLTEAAVEEQLKFFQLKLSGDVGMFVIKIIEKFNRDELSEEWNKSLLLYAVQNIFEELLQDWQPNLIVRDKKDNIIAITPVRPIAQWVEFGPKIEAIADKYLKQVIIVGQKPIKDGLFSIPVVYENLIKELNEKVNCTPVVFLAKKYIDTYYYKEDLSLQEVANEHQISSTYLSKLLKRETGASFIDYLTQTRIKKAIEFIKDPTIKIYEIAEKVGYSSQHYFSTAFKKTLGVSPVEYRKRGKSH